MTPVSRKLAWPAGLLVVAALAAGLVSCDRSSDALGPGPMPPENPSSQCLPARLDQAVTSGFDSIFNPGPGTVVIERIIVDAPRHIRLAGIYVFSGEQVVGDWPEFPPPAKALLRFHIVWSQRHRPAGYRLPPRRWAAFAVGLAPTSATASIAGLDVLYHIGSTHYEWRGKVRTVIEVSPKRCF